MMKPLIFFILCVARGVHYRNDPTNNDDSVRLTAYKIFDVAPGGGQGKHSITGESVSSSYTESGSISSPF